MHILCKEFLIPCELGTEILFIVCLMCRTVVFGAGNHEPEFVACLTYCLLQLTADIKIK